MIDHSRRWRNLCLAIALLLAACQTDIPRHPHETQRGTRLPVQATPVLNAADALPGHSFAAPPAPDPHARTAAPPGPGRPGTPRRQPRRRPGEVHRSSHGRPTGFVSPDRRSTTPTPPTCSTNGATALSGRILAHRPLAGRPADGDAKRLSAILDAARPPGGSPPVSDLHDDDRIAVLGSRRGITYGRWIAGAADTLSMSFDLSPRRARHPAARGDFCPC